MEGHAVVRLNLVVWIMQRIQEHLQTQRHSQATSLMLLYGLWLNASCVVGYVCKSMQISLETADRRTLEHLLRRPAEPI